MTPPMVGSSNIDFLCRQVRKDIDAADVLSSGGVCDSECDECDERVCWWRMLMLM